MRQKQLKPASKKRAMSDRSSVRDSEERGNSVSGRGSKRARGENDVEKVRCVAWLLFTCRLSPPGHHASFPPTTPFFLFFLHPSNPSLFQSLTSLVVCALNMASLKKEEIEELLDFSDLPSDNSTLSDSPLLTSNPTSLLMRSPLTLNPMLTMNPSRKRTSRSAPPSGS